MLSKLACLAIQWLLQTTTLWNTSSILIFKRRSPLSFLKKKKKRKKWRPAKWNLSFVPIFSSVSPGKTCYFSFPNVYPPFSACVFQNRVSFLILALPTALVFFFPLILFFVFKHHQISLTLKIILLKPTGYYPVS